MRKIFFILKRKLNKKTILSIPILSIIPLIVGTIEIREHWESIGTEKDLEGRLKNANLELTSMIYEIKSTTDKFILDKNKEREIECIIGKNLIFDINFPDPLKPGSPESIIQAREDMLDEYELSINDLTSLLISRNKVISSDALYANTTTFNNIDHEFKDIFNNLESSFSSKLFLSHLTARYDNLLLNHVDIVTQERNISISIIEDKKLSNKPMSTRKKFMDKRIENLATDLKRCKPKFNKLHETEEIKFDDINTISGEWVYLLE
ncbi:hypothetical protein [Sessilibacter corallicola]|uniref:hypothetical protein n=1 Tax=Sessilibacter corallicola TaxID=2904075 RepID=UPI001E5D2D92|nr:hypothetical protein [Sessilibacter corallicola]MCE2030366.1 hypothetical protein [Sessilibacter corallicola]